MMAKDRNALICDLAETYGIFDIRALPVHLLATLSVGLRDNSRIKMLLGGTPLTRTEQLLAAVADRVSMLLWMLSEDGRKGINQPKSILSAFMGEESHDNHVTAFDSPEDYERVWAQITGVKHGG